MPKIASGVAMHLESAPEAPHRLDVFTGHVATALRELHVTPHPGALSGVLAQCCLKYLGKAEREFMLGVFVQAAEPAAQERVWRIQAGLPWENLK